MTRVKLFGVAFVVGLGLSPVLAPFLTPALAQATGSDEGSGCDTAVTQAELNACVYAEYERSDTRLNAVWKQAMALMATIDRELPQAERGAATNLRTGQKAWISFRDATCAAEAYLMHGGSAEAMQFYGCMDRLTTQRSDDLAAMVEMGQ